MTNNDVAEEHWNANYIHEQWKIDCAYSNFQGSQTIESPIISWYHTGSHQSWISPPFLAHKPQLQ